MNTVIGKGLESFINQEAREKALGILDEAREKAEQRVTEAEKQAAVDVRRTVNAQATVIQSHEKQAIAQLKLDAHRFLIAHQEENVEEIWQKATKELAEIQNASSERRAEILTTLIADALEQFGADRAKLQLAEHDLPLATEEQLKAWHKLGAEHGVKEIVLIPEPAAIMGGAILTDDDETIVVDNSFEERLRLVEQDLRDRVGQILVSED